jgi:hypothetical protein
MPMLGMLQFPDPEYHWLDTRTIPGKDWRCGYCAREVSGDRGWELIETDFGGRETPVAWVAVCPRCNGPSFIAEEGQIPPAPQGTDIEHLPEGIRELYGEARRTIAASAPTSAVMAGRKLLMAVAVERGADGDLKFIQYVNWLVEKGIVTEPMCGFVDEIRQLGNEANHEIRLMTQGDAEEMLTYVEMLLKVVYEYPGRAEQARLTRAFRDGK